MIFKPLLIILCVAKRAERHERMKIVVLDGYTENPGDLSWAGFEALGDLTVYERTASGDVIARIGDAEIAITNKTPITREVLQACRKVRYIGVLATGYNVVDLKAAAEKGITVTNIPTYGTAAVAQMTFALLLEICNHVGYHSREVEAGKWTDCLDFCFYDRPLTELFGKTLGIIGFGRIGRAIAKLADAFGMRVLAVTHSETADMPPYAEAVSVRELLNRSDVVTLHCPLTQSTQRMINVDAIAEMKDGVVILNTARGPLIDEEALADALKSGKVAAAGLDVVSVEPIRADNPLLSAPNCIITPHIAWAPKESRARLMDIAVSNLKAYLSGAPENVVK